jgi:hypothetical protein
VSRGTLVCVVCLVSTIALALLVGCSVDRSVLDEQVFGCRRDGDCTDGYGCQLVDATGNGFCAEVASSAAECDGFVTAGDLCLSECVPGGEPCAEDLACVSSDVLQGEAGYCAPLDTCSADADCAGEEACLSTVIREFVGTLWGPHEFAEASNLSCVPRCADGGDCPTGTECLDALLPGLAYCLPRCGDDSACPLGFACYATAGTSIGICMPGISGLECRDDASCLAGTCETFGEGDQEIQICVSSCDGSVEAPPCTDAALVGGRLNVYQCTAVAEGGEFCIFRGGYLHSCDPDRRSQDCVDGLVCQLVPAEGGQAAACVQSCVPDAAAPNQDRNGDCADNAFCFPGSFVDPPFIDACVFDMADGAACLFDDQCASGACHLETSCGDQPDLGCCGPP